MSKRFMDLLEKLDPAPTAPGELARILRKDQNLTLKDLEVITGIKENNLSALENGRLELTKYYAAKLSAALGVHPATLMFPDGWEAEDDEFREIQSRAERIKKRKRA